MVILDTNIIIDHLRRFVKTDSYLYKITEEQTRAMLGISVVSIQELYEGKSTLNAQKEQFLLSTVSSLKLFSYTYEVAQLAGEISRDLKRSIDIVDAAIAATAIHNNCELFTLNQKDFQDIKGLKLYPLEQLNP